MYKHSLRLTVFIYVCFLHLYLSMYKAIQTCGNSSAFPVPFLHIYSS